MHISLFHVFKDLHHYHNTHIQGFVERIFTRFQGFQEYPNYKHRY